MAPVRAFPAGGEALGKGWRGGGIDVGRRELFTRYRGTRPFNSYGRNDNIVGGGEECLENASSSTPACIVTLRDEFEKDNFSARFAIRRERKTDATKRGGGFLSNKLFERDGRHSFLLLLLLVGRSLVISIGPTLRLSSKCQSFLKKKKRAKRQARIFPPLCPFGGW